MSRRADITFARQEQEQRATEFPRAVLYEEVRAIYEAKLSAARQAALGPLTKEQFDACAITSQDFRVAYETRDAQNNRKLGLSPHRISSTMGYAFVCNEAGVPFQKLGNSKKSKK